jgi:hypothetical protein
MKSFQFIFVRWLPFALLATIMAGLVYVAVQQDIRMSANDPQIELAEDGAGLLAQGQPAELFGTSAGTDMARSLLPFVLVYDQNGKPLNGTATLNGSIPVPPQGVFDYAKQKGEHRLTWQPMTGIRIAAVIVPYQGKQPGFILAGRSLREVENRESMLMVYVFAAWLGALISTYILVAFQTNLHQESRKAF